MHRASRQGPLPSQGGLPRLKSRDSDPRQLHCHNPFSGLQSQGHDRQPQHVGPHERQQAGPQSQQQAQGLSHYQHHQIQQAYNTLMQHKQQLSADEGPSHQPPHEPAYPLQPVPSRPGPNSMLSLPSYRILPALTSNDLDTIMKLRQQLSGENGLLTRLSSFMQAQRSSDHRPMPGPSSLQDTLFMHAPMSIGTQQWHAFGFT